MILFLRSSPPLYAYLFLFQFNPLTFNKTFDEQAFRVLRHLSRCLEVHRRTRQEAWQVSPIINQSPFLLRWQVVNRISLLKAEVKSVVYKLCSLKSLEKTFPTGKYTWCLRSDTDKSTLYIGTKEQWKQNWLGPHSKKRKYGVEPRVVTGPNPQTPTPIQRLYQQKIVSFTFFILYQRDRHGIIDSRRQQEK